MEGVMKYFIQVFLLACTTAPSVKKLTHDNIKNKDCLTPLDHVCLSPGETVLNLFQQSAGTAGNVVATAVAIRSWREHSSSVPETIFSATTYSGAMWVSHLTRVPESFRMPA